MSESDAPEEAGAVTVPDAVLEFALKVIGQILDWRVLVMLPAVLLLFQAVEMSMLPVDRREPGQMLRGVALAFEAISSSSLFSVLGWVVGAIATIVAVVQRNHYEKRGKHKDKVIVELREEVDPSRLSAKNLPSVDVYNAKVKGQLDLFEPAPSDEDT